MRNLKKITQLKSSTTILSLLLGTNFLYAMSSKIHANEFSHDLIKPNSGIDSNDLHRNMYVEFGFAPIFVNYKNLDQAYNFFLELGIKNHKNKTSSVSIFIYNRFHPQISGTEKDNYFAYSYYLLSNKNEKFKNLIGGQIGCLYSFGSNTPIPYYPSEIESYKLNFYSLGIIDKFQINFNQKHSLNLSISLDIGFLSQNIQKKNNLTGEILSNSSEQFITAYSFKPLILSYSIKF